MHNVGRWIESNVIAFADHDHLAPFTGAANRHSTRAAVCRTIDCALTAVAFGHFHDLCMARFGIYGIEYIVRETQILSQLHTLFIDVCTDGHSTYNSLLESGWRMDEIDRMDMPGFLKMRAWNARREQKKKEPRQRYIDEVWSSLSPSAM